MQTRAKFQCYEVTKSKGWSGTPAFLYSAKFQVVTATNEENKKFFTSTPSGSIEIRTYREDQFQPGEEYYIDFIPAFVKPEDEINPETHN